MATESAESPGSPQFPPQMTAFSERLTFLRIFVLHYKSSSAFAEDLGYAPSTYATWEAGTPPRDKVEIAQRIVSRFSLSQDVLDWLLRGGEVILFTYSDLCAVEEHQLRLPFDLPRSVQNAVLSVAS